MATKVCGLTVRDQTTASAFDAGPAPLSALGAELNQLFDLHCNLLACSAEH